MPQRRHHRPAVPVGSVPGQLTSLTHAPMRDPAQFTDVPQRDNLFITAALDRVVLQKQHVPRVGSEDLALRRSHRVE